MNASVTNTEKMIRVEINNRAAHEAASLEYEQKFGSMLDRDYDQYRADYAEIYKKHVNIIEYTNFTMEKVQQLAEAMRIEQPDANINISWNHDGEYGPSFIANTSWNDQMKMYPGYEVYTKEGFIQKVEALKKYHKGLVDLGNWSPEYQFSEYYNEVMENQPNLQQFEEAQNC